MLRANINMSGEWISPLNCSTAHINGTRMTQKNLNIFLISSNTIQYCFFCEFLALSLDLWTFLTCNPWGEKKRNSYESKISLIVCCAKTNTLYGRRHLHYTTPRNQQPTSSWHFLVWWESLIWNCILIYYWQYVVPQISL